MSQNNPTKENDVIYKKHNHQVMLTNVSSKNN
jgi:hypothetical protein